MAIGCIYMNFDIHAQQSDALITVTNSDNLFSGYPKTFLKDVFSSDRMSPDGKHIAGGVDGDVYILAFDGSEPVYIRPRTGLEWITDFEWTSDSEIMLNGITGGREKNVKYNITTGSTDVGSPLSGSIEDKAGGNTFYSDFDKENDKGGVYMKARDNDPPRLVLPGIYPAAMALSADGKSLAYLYLKDPDNLCLGIFGIDSMKGHDLATGLDGSLKSRIAFDPDNRHVLLSLVTDKLDNYKKHQPKADRDLDLYAVHIKTGAIIPILREEGDDILIGVEDNKVIWNKVLPNVRTCISPIDGSRIIPLIPELSFLPSWNSKGDKIALVYGNWRAADAPLNWNIGLVSVDTAGKASGTLTPLTEGFQEEYNPAWAPKGIRILYSARQNTPAFPTLESQSTDDLFIRDQGKMEHKLTNQFTEISDVAWSPDENRAVVSAVNKGDSVYRAWLIAIPEDTGEMAAVNVIKLPGDIGNILSVAWSSDGKMIAAESGYGSENRSMWIFSPEGKDIKKLTDYKSMTFNSGLNYTPDGKSIIYSGYDGKHQQLYKITATGGTPEKLTDNAYDLVYPVISPNGDRIAVTLYRHLKQVWTADITYQ